MTVPFTGVARAAIADEIVFDRVSGGGSDSTRFQLASVSKAFTAAATLLLVDRHQVALDDRVERWFAPVPAAWSAITVHQLLTHSGGLPHWEDLPNLDLTEQMEHAAEVAQFKEAPLKFEPGAGWYYSSPAYVLLALIVQQESGRRYADFLQSEICRPLGLAATFAGDAHGQPNVAEPLRAEQPTKSFALDTTGMGAGDVWSTADDMLRWHRALSTGAILSQESRRRTFERLVATPSDARMTLPSIEVDGYGYAWFTGSIEGSPAVFHTGGNAGFRTFNAIVPERELSLVVLCNDEECDIWPTVAELLEAVRAAS